MAGFLAPEATILDIGCGSGRDMGWFAEYGFQPTGFELSPSLAQLARKHSGCKVFEGDFTQYDFSDFQVDALVFAGSLVHLPEQDLAHVLKSTCRAHTPVTLEK